MSKIKKNLKYTKSHEWVKDNNGFYTMGITDYAQELLGDIVFVELAAVGDKFSGDDELCIIESVKAASSVYAPISLEVIEINTNLIDNPDIINQDCYGDGWLVKFKANNIDKLLESDSYQDLLNSPT